MKPNRIIGLLFILLTASTLLQAELLVIKHTKNGFAALEAQDEPNKIKIADILLAYQWPMVIGNSNLTEQEMDELLTADVPNAEETFIRKKVKEIDVRYDIVFFPTALYQLYTATTFQNNYLLTAIKDKSAKILLTHEAKQLSKKQPENSSQMLRLNFDTEKILSNNVFYPEIFFLVNDSLANVLLAFDSTLKHCTNATVFSDKIEARAQELAQFFFSAMKDSLCKCEKSDAQNPKLIDTEGVLFQGIALEYEARSINKALLWRGSDPIKLLIKKNCVPLPILGSTIKECILWRLDGTIKERALSLQDINKNIKNELTPYSISFGNSLFGGLVFDLGACAYAYLTERGGYAVSLDKKYHIKNLYAGPSQSLDLFHINTFAPIVELFAHGEFFHPRIKEAKPKVKPQEECFLSIERDPFLHAELFSRYLAENMRVITKNHESSAQRKAYEKKIKDAQKQAAECYKAGVKNEKPVAA